MSKKFKTLDLFAGCGGLTEGFEQSGLFETVGLVEWEKPAIKTLVNRLEKKWKYKNVQDISLYFDMQRTEELLHGWDDLKYGKHPGLLGVVKDKGDVDVVVGGPPCQAYSIAGRVRDEDGMRNDYRNYLFETYLAVVNKLRPKVFVFENVLGLLSANPDGTPITELIKKGFEDIGYSIVNDLTSAVSDVSEYGVPQIRKRLIILGINKDVFKGDSEELFADFYNNILPSHKTKKKTVGEAILDLPKMKIVSRGRISHEVIGVSGYFNHTPRFHSDRDISIFRELASDLTRENRKYASVEDLKRLYSEMTGKKSSVHKYYVLDPKKQSNTIVAHLYKDGLRHIHPDPEQGRSITVREAARLQSFPDDFEFLGSMGDQYKMIGNAVPPQFAEVVSRSVASFICKYG